MVKDDQLTEVEVTFDLISSCTAEHLKIVKIPVLHLVRKLTLFLLEIEPLLQILQIWASLFVIPCNLMT